MSNRRVRVEPASASAFAVRPFDQKLGTLQIFTRAQAQLHIASAPVPGLTDVPAVALLHCHAGWVQLQVDQQTVVLNHHCGEIAQLAEGRVQLEQLLVDIVAQRENERAQISV